MTPLQPTDLIKNLLFQRASAEGEDVEALYRSKWQRFEDPFWESEVTQGRLVRPRFTIFMNYWLTSQTGASVMSGDVFRDFKRMLQAGGRSTVEVLDAIVSAAEGYRQVLEGARRDGEISRRELTVYRLLESDVGALWPVLLYLLQVEQERRDLSAAIDRSLALLESWVVRRTALSMTMSGVNRQVIDMLDRLRTDEVGPDEALERYLRGLRGDSAVWPDDAMIRSKLTEKKVYTSLKRSRLRMILEALEDEARGFVSGHARTSHSRMVRRATEVEHIMPTSWREHWPLGEDGDEVARDRAVNTIGNLALLPQRFNASIQNIEWGTKDGKGKRAAFHKSSADLLLHDVLERDVWDEAEIAARSRSLVDAFIQTWPVPEGHSVPRAESSGPRPNVIRELIERGALREGDVLVGRGQDRGLEAIVTGDGALHVEGERYDSPTAAAMAHKTSKGADSGNSFWRLGESGPSLLDLRAQVLGFEAIRVGSTSTIVSKRWALLRLLLRALPSGTWTTYGDVADVIRSHANPVGQHIARNRVEHAWRVLQAGGTASPGFRWTSEEYQGADPMEMLAAEGVGVVGGVADPSRRLRSSDLRDLLDVEGLTLLAEIEGAAGLSVAALADELSIRPEVIRVWLRAKPGAESAKQSSEWLLDQELADWIREHHASAEGDVA